MTSAEAFLDASTRARERIAIELQAHGITKPGSTHQLCTLLKANRLDHHFPKTKLGRPRTRDQDLKDREHLHPAISLVRRWRKVGQLAADPAVQGLITGVDGRVHSDFMVLGADSGRTQSRRPNLMGIGRAFRPLVCAAEGYGIGEVDLAQIEVGIAAAVFRDEAMIADFNGGDVYVATAKRVFKHQIRDEDLRLSDREFQREVSPASRPEQAFGPGNHLRKDSPRNRDRSWDQPGRGSGALGHVPEPLPDLMRWDGAGASPVNSPRLRLHLGATPIPGGDRLAHAA